MPVKSIRFSDSLAAAYQARADELDRSFSWVILRTLESALSDGAAGDGPRSIARPVDEPAVSTRAPVEKEQPGPKVAPREPAAAAVKKPDSRRTPSLKDTWGR